MGKESVEIVVSGSQPEAIAVRQRVNLIQEVMAGVMKDGEHYGIIPGCGKKPTLLKPGAEKLLSTFQIAPEFKVEDLSTLDSVRYRVTARGLSSSGVFLGEGLGECSTMEDKFKWRRCSSQLEYEATADDRRRQKYTNYGPMNQVRTEPYDYANTVLKMAKKRALVDMVLTVTAASDIFTQDIEDMDIDAKPHSEEGKKKSNSKKTDAKKEQKQDIPMDNSGASQSENEPSNGPVNDSDKNLFVRFADAQKWPYDAVIKILKEEFKVPAVLDLTRDQFESALEIIKAGPDKWEEVNAK